MSSNMKFLAAAGLLLIWGSLVAMGQAPVEGYLSTIRDALVALGVFTASMANPKE